MTLKSSPTSIKKLRQIANEIRQEFNVTDIYFPIVDILDKLCLEDKLLYLILEDENPLFNEGELARYSVNENTIFIKDSVYEEAVDNIGRSRFTLTHELAHYYLLKVYGFEIIETDEDFEAYENPEWQANTLAAELLIPYDLTKDFTFEELMDKCVVSDECALVELKKRNNIKV